MDCVGSVLEGPGFVYVSVNTPTDPDDGVSGALLIDTPLPGKSIEMKKKRTIKIGFRFEV